MRPPIARPWRTLNEALALETTHQPGHGGGPDLLGCRQPAHGDWPFVNDDREGGESRARQPGSNVLLPEAAQQAYGHRVQPIREFAGALMVLRRVHIITQC